MAIFVVLATITGVVIVALTTSGNEDLEASGSTDLGENCRPNEVRDQALESMGISGTHEHLDQYQSDTIGCKPYCGTWEYYSKGQNANGQYEYDPDAALGATIGGPDGAGGVYSSNIGCFAPCYLNWGYSSNVWRPKPAKITHTNLKYFDDNRLPRMRQFRLGVNYVRAAEGTTLNHFRFTDIENHDAGNNNDKKPFLITRPESHWGSRFWAGRHPTPTELTELQARGVPTVYIPNFRSRFDDPAASGNTRSVSEWEDEDWEYRADPINRTCSILNVATDQLVCSSEWSTCGYRPS